MGTGHAEKNQPMVEGGKGNGQTYFGKELRWLQRGSKPTSFFVVADVWAEGYSHHITRLMVLSNLPAFLDVWPREITDWFWVAYTDAYDWVVKPNVPAMDPFAVGELITTKPYISGAAYIDRMSDFCPECSFDPRRNFPITNLSCSYPHPQKLFGRER